MKCPNCKSENVREYFVDDMNNELNEAQINDLTTHEKELAAECKCEDCCYSDAKDGFLESELGYDSIFDTLADITRPMNICYSMKKYW